MKPFRRWRRILFLSLLSLSVLAPLALVKLKTLSLEVNQDFVEDLSSVKHSAEAVQLNAVEQKDDESIKEPRLEVYRDQVKSIISYSSITNLVAKESNSGSSSGLGRQGETHDDKEGIASVHILRKEMVASESSQKKQQSDAVNAEHGRRFQPPPAPKNQWSSQDAQAQNRMVSDEKVMQLKDQLVSARVYLNFATSSDNTQLAKKLRQRIKEVEQVLGDARRDSELHRSASSRMRNMELALSKARRAYPDCSEMVKKLRAMGQSAEDQVQAQRNQTSFLTQLAGRTIPKGLHCLSMRLTAEYFNLQPMERKPRNQENFYDPKLFHYVVFSDNILASAVVVNSTVSASQQPEKIVFHVVTDSINFPGISMWFLLNPPGKAAVHVQSTADFKHITTKHSSSLEIPQHSTDPRFSSPLNHLRFYLPVIFPKLDKVLFLDHDVVVQKDLSALWNINMKGKVNGAVQSCQGEYLHQKITMLINCSDPWVNEVFDADSCTWAYGMNIFDLREWRNLDLSTKYRRFLLMGQKKALWKAGSLPLGWITFYNHTLLLPQQWHVHGLGYYDSGVSTEIVEKAAVIHYDGIMKPWLDIGMKRFKGYWNKHVNFNNPYIRQCNIHG